MRRPKSISSNAMRELDRAAIQDWGIPSRVLMENAGREVVHEVMRFLRAERAGRAVRSAVGIQDDAGVLPQKPTTVAELEEWKAEIGRVTGPVCVVCGPGNNGGDGFVVARTLLNHGVSVDCCFIGAASGLEPKGGAATSDAVANAQLLKRCGGTILVVEKPEGLEALERRLSQAMIVVDALFGIGPLRPLEGVYRGAVEAINRADKPCIAVDIPSGIDADTGSVMGAAVMADVTVTFAAAKHGLLRGAGPDHTGRLKVAEIGIPRVLIDAAMKSAG